MDSDRFMFIEGPSGKSSLFHADDIPVSIKPEGEWHIASVAIVNEDSILFTIQVSANSEQGIPASVRLIRYDITDREFTLLHHFDELGTAKSVMIGNLMVSADGLYAALDLISEQYGQDYRPHVIVYSLTNNDWIIVDDFFVDSSIQGTNSFYWDGNLLHLTMGSADQQLQFTWDAANRKLSRPQRLWPPSTPKDPARCRSVMRGQDPSILLYG